MNSAVPVRKGDHISAVIQRALEADPELTLTGLGHRLGGWPEETMRSYRDGDTSPSYDRVVAACGRRTLAGHVVLDLAQTLAGQRALVCLVDISDLPAVVRPADVMHKLMEALCRFQVLLHDVYDRAADGVICAADAAALAKGWAEIRQLGERAVRLSQHCAARAARRA